MNLVQDYSSDDEDEKEAVNLGGSSKGLDAPNRSQENIEDGLTDERASKRVKLEQTRPDTPEQVLSDDGKGDSGHYRGDGKLSSEVNAYQGRLRSFPHQEGSYATHVYASVTIPEHVRETLNTVLMFFKHQAPLLQPVLASDASPSKETLMQPCYHVSLSRVVPIRYHEIELLLLSLKEALTCTVRENISFGDIEVFENDDHTRTFVSLGVSKGRKEVCNAIRRVNRAFRDHSLKQFHSQPQPHVSVLWMLGSMTESLENVLAEQNCREGTAQVHQALESLKLWTFPLETIWCKIGLRVTKVWASKHVKPQ